MKKIFDKINQIARVSDIRSEAMRTNTPKPAPARPCKDIQHPQMTELMIRAGIRSVNEAKLPKPTMPDKEYVSSQGNKSKSGVIRSPGTGSGDEYEEPELDGEFETGNDDDEDYDPDDEEEEEDEDEVEESLLGGPRPNSDFPKAAVPCDCPNIKGKCKCSVKESMDRLLEGLSAKAHYKKVMAQGKMAPIDQSDYPPIKGLEGPFRFKSGRILYYDPQEGKYYDRGRDMYLSNKDALRATR